MAKSPKPSTTKKPSGAKTGRTSTKVKPAVRESRRLNAEQKRSVLPSVMKPQISPQPPKTPLSLKGMSLKAIYSNTPMMMKENGRECVFKSFKRSVSPKGFPVLKAVVIHRDPFRPKATDCPHTVTLVGIDSQSDPFCKQKRVFVQCDCQNFCYMWEYSLAEHGATHIIFGNGEPPIFTNPSRVPGTCKHMSAVIQRVMREKI